MNHIIVKDAIGKVEWENFLLNVKQPPFLQSWNMKTLHDHISEQSFQIGIYDNGHLVGVALTILVKAKRGCYLYLPYGPVFTNWKSEYFQALTTFLTQKAKELRVDFIRSSPFIENNNTHQQIYSTHGWKKAPIHMLAEHIWWLDIDKSEDELLKGMRKTMRNLIRRAGKEGVTIEISKNPNDVDIFINI
ncbi:MAG: aminoacyltransferase, partial [Candidatus Thermoplasmatota archaeon]|nr:aminoacyltransferase [Candidatus Thermoplasmatota archaeon]